MTRKGMFKDKLMGVTLCACGCGGATNIYRGVPRRFILGHNGRANCKPLDRYVVDPVTDCHIWTGRITKGGYARQGSNYVHRTVWERLHGPLPKDRELHHRCERKACINPAHLMLVTHSQHELIHAPAVCKHGHPFDDANTYWHKGLGIRQRKCRRCNRDRQARYRAERRAAA